jgi:hypothetical protein
MNIKKREENRYRSSRFLPTPEGFLLGDDKGMPKRKLGTRTLRNYGESLNFLELYMELIRLFSLRVNPTPAKPSFP